MYRWEHIGKWSHLYSGKLLMAMPTVYLGRIYGELWLGNRMDFAVQDYTFTVLISIDQVRIVHKQIHTTLGTVADTLELFGDAMSSQGLDRAATIWWNDCRGYGAGFSLECCGAVAGYLLPYYSTGISVTPGVMKFNGNTHYRVIGIRQLRESLIELVVDGSSRFITPYALEYILVTYRLDLLRHAKPAYTLDQVYVFMGSATAKL